MYTIGEFFKIFCKTDFILWCTTGQIVQVQASDCEACERKSGKIDHIEREVELICRLRGNNLKEG